MTSAPAIGFEYQPSRWLIRVLGMAALCAVLAIGLSGWPWWLALPASSLPPWALWRTSRAWLASPVLAAGWSREGAWNLRMRGGEDIVASLVSCRVIGRRAVWLRLALPAGRHAVLLLAPDNSDADIRRRLRMRLAQWSAPGTSVAERGPTVSPRLGR